MDEASAVVFNLPEIKCLRLMRSTVPRESLKLILQRCKKLVVLDATDCLGFNDDDEELTSLGSHIKYFKLQNCVQLDDSDDYDSDDDYYQNPWDSYSSDSYGYQDDIYQDWVMTCIEGFYY
ncbi:hypothetical protein GIB67_003808 [Kingdonia uniflora]|uniref:Uncharacterized protein n=1 Tax=Kingdonia uniflora TaxID=39325 RepID=A0A7J7P2X3_9MAGN|nr:hypothetical protein GIB67_003808 [Kingdonia uniflora]